MFCLTDNEKTEEEIYQELEAKWGTRRETIQLAEGSSTSAHSSKTKKDEKGKRLNSASNVGTKNASAEVDESKTQKKATGLTPRFRRKKTFQKKINVGLSGSPKPFSQFLADEGKTAGRSSPIAALVDLGGIQTDVKKVSQDLVKQKLVSSLANALPLLEDFVECPLRHLSRFEYGKAHLCLVKTRKNLFLESVGSILGTFASCESSYHNLSFLLPQPLGSLNTSKSSKPIKKYKTHDSKVLKADTESRSVKNSENAEKLSLKPVEEEDILDAIKSRKKEWDLEGQKARQSPTPGIKSVNAELEEFVLYQEYEQCFHEVNNLIDFMVACSSGKLSENKFEVLFTCAAPFLNRNQSEGSVQKSAFTRFGERYKSAPDRERQLFSTEAAESKIDSKLQYESARDILLQDGAVEKIQECSTILEEICDLVELRLKLIEIYLKGRFGYIEALLNESTLSSFAPKLDSWANLRSVNIELVKEMEELKVAFEERYGEASYTHPTAPANKSCTNEDEPTAEPALGQLGKCLLLEFYSLKEVLAARIRLSEYNMQKTVLHISHARMLLRQWCTLLDQNDLQRNVSSNTLDIEPETRLNSQTFHSLHVSNMKIDHNSASGTAQAPEIVHGKPKALSMDEASLDVVARSEASSALISNILFLRSQIRMLTRTASLAFYDVFSNLSSTDSENSDHEMYNNYIRLFVEGEVGNFQKNNWKASVDVGLILNADEYGIQDVPDSLRSPLSQRKKKVFEKPDSPKVERKLQRLLSHTQMSVSPKQHTLSENRRSSQSDLPTQEAESMEGNGKQTEIETGSKREIESKISFRSHHVSNALPVFGLPNGYFCCDIPATPIASKPSMVKIDLPMKSSSENQMIEKFENDIVDATEWDSTELNENRSFSGSCDLFAPASGLNQYPLIYCYPKGQENRKRFNMHLPNILSLLLDRKSKLDSLEEVFHAEGELQTVYICAQIDPKMTLVVRYTSLSKKTWKGLYSSLSQVPPSLSRLILSLRCFKPNQTD